MKKLLFIFFFTIFAISHALAATLYVKAAGGNYSAAGTWSNVDAAGVDNSGPCTSADTCIAELASGNLTIDAASAAASFSTTSGTGTYGGTITHNGFNWGLGTLTLNSGMTYTPLATSTITLNATNTLTTGGKLLPLLNLTGATTLADNVSFIASKVITLTVGGITLNLNGKTVSGNSATNRVLVRSNTFGTARTIIVASGTFANADFREITFSNGGNDLDLSAITGKSGDCGGNSNVTGGKVVTFTTAATQTFSGTTSDSWSTNAWTSRVPLPQDDVVISSAFSASQTVTADMPRLGKSISLTGSTGTPTLDLNTITNTIYGSLTLISGMTLTVGTTATPTFEGRGSFTITSAGKSFSQVTMAMIGGTLTLQDAFSATAASSFSFQNGTLDTNGFAFTVRAFIDSLANTRVITMGNSTWTLTGGSGDIVWSGLNVNTGQTVNANTSTVSITGTSGNVDFRPGTITLNNITVAAGSNIFTINSGSNTITANVFTMGAGRTWTLPAGRTQTFSSLILKGTAGNVITIQSGTAASAATISQATGAVYGRYLSIKDSTATGGALFRAYQSTSVSGNTGWVFPNMVQNY